MFSALISVKWSYYSPRRAMNQSENNRPWDRNSGIQLSSRPGPQILYPQLDLARFVHIDCFNSTTESHHDVDDPKTWNRNASNKSASDLRAARVSALRSSPDDLSVISDVNGRASGIDEIPTATHSESDTSPPLPVTSSQYNISSKLFYAARKAVKGSPESFWSHTMYESHGADGTRRKVKVHYCTSKHTTEYVCRKHFLGEKVLGFDLEWFPYATKTSGPRENVSVIQIASPGRIGIFHVALFPQKDELVAPTFRKIMEDGSVSKVGVNILGDCTRLKNNLGIDSRGIFELSHLYKLVKYSPEGRADLINKQRVALAVQVEECLHLPLYKGGSVRSSNWTLPLNIRQINYSAADAYAGLQLYLILEQKRKQLKPTPPRPYHAELGRPIKVVLPSPESSDIEDDNVVISPGAVALPKSTLHPHPKASPAKKSIAAPKDQRITAAEESLAEYRKSVGRSLKAAPWAIRAYYIWHANDDLNPEAIAQLLRDPPLKTNTVVTYILDSVSSESLPYSMPRLKDEVLSHLSIDIGEVKKYHSLAEACRRS
ncbi:Werner syndrome ATP-dependent helicase [Paramyrothecium foliicola]|nr:Werner syndrome ATP-dependent helicase [Paramyrothecium foliicola]